MLFCDRALLVPLSEAIISLPQVVTKSARTREPHRMPDSAVSIPWIAH